MAALDWGIEVQNSWVAFGLVRRYCIMCRVTDRGDRYSVTVDGYPIGASDTLDGAKRYAQSHNDR